MNYYRHAEVEKLFQFAKNEIEVLRSNIETPNQYLVGKTSNPISGVLNGTSGLCLDSISMPFYALYLSIVSGMRREIDLLLATNRFTGEHIDTALSLAADGCKRLFETRLRIDKYSCPRSDGGISPDVVEILYPISSKRTGENKCGARVFEFGHPAISRLVQKRLVDKDYREGDETLLDFLLAEIKDRSLVLDLINYESKITSADADSITSDFCEWDMASEIIKSARSIDDEAACMIFKRYSDKHDFEDVFLSRANDPCVIRGVILAHEKIDCAYRMLVPVFINQKEFVDACGGLEDRYKNAANSFCDHLVIQSSMGSSHEVRQCNTGMTISRRKLL